MTHAVVLDGVDAVLMVGVETADHPTGGEIVAQARRYFTAGDRMGNR